MKDELTISREELRRRARWFTYRYDLPEDQVIEALRRTKITREEEWLSETYEYLKFEPSLDSALRFLSPKVALKLFLEADTKKLSAWLLKVGVFVEPYADHEVDIEEITRWEAESMWLD